jgi:hypothetical protein
MVNRLNPLTGCGKTPVFRGSQRELRHKVRGFNRALAPEKQILAFFRSLLKHGPSVSECG